MITGNKLRLRTVFVLVAAWLSLAVAGCAGGGADPEATEPAVGSYVGKVDDTDALIAVVVYEAKLVAYACDGDAELAEWFSIGSEDLEADDLAASSKGGAELSMQWTGTGFEGALTTAAGRIHGFVAVPVIEPAGLYLRETGYSDGALQVGWVVDSDGGTRGAFTFLGRTTTAPTLDTAVEIEGEETPIILVDPRVDVAEATVAAPPGEVLAASFDWEMPERYDASWDAWGHELLVLEVEDPLEDEVLFGYDPAFVHPEVWHPRFDACASTEGLGSIERYHWEVTRDGAFVDSAETTECLLANLSSDPDRRRLDFPSEGVYAVRLTVENEAGDTASMLREVNVRDILIVSLGDSSASGEGNLDEVDSLGLPVYLFNRCHRSKTSGHAFAARAIEEADPHTSVTFLSFACSGASIPKGLLGTYFGTETARTDSTSNNPRRFVHPLPPQVDQARRATCRVDPEQCRPVDQRMVDHLFVAIGINDIRFSKVIVECVTSTCHDVTGEAQALVDGGLERLEGEGDHSIAHLARALDGSLPSAHRFLTGYPDNPFGDRKGEPDEGCGVFKSIDVEGAKWLKLQGERLNGTLRRLADGHDFGFADGVAKDFRRHGYCTSRSWYRDVSDSVFTQFDVKGGLHPIAPGHRAIAGRVVAAVESQLPTDTFLDARVTIDAIRVEPGKSTISKLTGSEPLVATDGNVGFEFVAQVFAVRDGASFAGGSTVYAGQFPAATWAELPEGSLAFELALKSSQDVQIMVGTPSGGLVLKELRSLGHTHGTEHFEMSGVRRQDGLKLAVRYSVETSPVLRAVAE
ncbi:MAG: SGNH/GDSL hydrolase family protein [Myxococcales bacterium]|nr:SGNH/GDSL hydrolase family protein [Myxococcales bacterium]